MVHHFLAAPIYGMAETILGFESCHVTDYRKLKGLVFILFKFESGVSRAGVSAQIFPLANCHDVEAFVHSSTNSKLDISSVSQHELGFLLGKGHPPASGILDLVSLVVRLVDSFAVRPLDLAVKRHQVVLAQLRRRLQTQRLAQQRPGQDGSGVALLQLGIDGHRRSDGGDEPPGTVGIPQCVVDQGLIILGFDCLRKAGFPPRHHLSTHTDSPPSPATPSEREGGALYR